PGRPAVAAGAARARIGVAAAFPHQVAVAAARHAILLIARVVDRLAHRPHLADRLASRVGARPVADFLDRLVAGLAHFTLVGLIDRPAGHILLLHGVLFPHRLADRVPALANVLLLDGVTHRIFAHDVKLFPDRLAHGGAAFAHFRMIRRLAHHPLPLFHHLP